ncbi:hypothetical protein OD040_004316 [Escherichia coli]|nr:hypothetical protein [Escherichia coli]EJX3064558.1 hypothetical protein [Escherichia coli]
MSFLDIKKMSKERFNAFVDWTRMPNTELLGYEFEWYCSPREFLLGALLLDQIDEDYSGIVLARDLSGRYRCIDLFTSVSEMNSARAKLKKLMRKHTKLNVKVFPQGDETYKAMDLFTPIVTPDKLHHHFSLFGKYANWSPATGIIKEMMNHFEDVDGNFIEQFQTTGFDARLWELYLFAYLREEHFWLDRQFNAPDYVARKYGNTICIEAVTVNPTGNNINQSSEMLSEPKSKEELLEKIENYMPIKFGSSLYSKLKKKTRYWDLEHVKGNPLIFAIADFHEPNSMIWSHSALWQYLYGIRYEHVKSEDGCYSLATKKIISHQFEKKEIPSGFFFLDESENISAVLSSNSGTISKFNRMGKLAGFGRSDLRLFRSGYCHDHDPEALYPAAFSFEVKEGDITETWAEGLNMYHNPNAKYPVDPDLFPSIAHHFLENGEVKSIVPDFHPYTSITINVLTQNNKKQKIRVDE